MALCEYTAVFDRVRCGSTSLCKRPGGHDTTPEPCVELQSAMHINLPIQQRGHQERAGRLASSNFLYSRRP